MPLHTSEYNYSVHTYIQLNVNVFLTVHHELTIH